jgi:excinuclease ABC subunit C
MENLDVIGVAGEGEMHQLVVLFIRKGLMQDSLHVSFRSLSATGNEVVEAYLKQHYTRPETFFPGKILLPEPVEERQGIEDWISRVAGKRVRLLHPRRGENRKLVHMASANARELLMRRKDPSDLDPTDLAGKVLGLRTPPRTIEGLDISNFQGDLAVGTLVSFREGKKDKKGYRNYRIKSIKGADDYGMMVEMVQRRLSKGHLPDLFLIDGGKGHLIAVKKAVEALPEETRPALAAIAKREEKRGEVSDKVYIPGRKNPLALRQDHPVLLYFMRIRDEAHRRAVGYHRKLREKQFKSSILDQIPGVGPSRRKALILRFKTVNAIAQASVEDLESVTGIHRSLAEKIFSFFNSP